MTEKYLTIDEIVKRTGYTYQTIAKKIRRGKLPAKRIGPSQVGRGNKMPFVVPEPEVEKLIQEKAVPVFSGKMLTTDEVARMLGRSTVMIGNYIRAGMIPAVRIKNLATPGRGWKYRWMISEEAAKEAKRKLEAKLPPFDDKPRQPGAGRPKVGSLEESGLSGYLFLPLAEQELKEIREIILTENRGVLLRWARDWLKIHPGSDLKEVLGEAGYTRIRTNTLKGDPAPQIYVQIPEDELREIKEAISVDNRLILFTWARDWLKNNPGGNLKEVLS